MSTSIATAEIRLTQNKDALAKLRRIGKLVKDAHGERFDAMFDGNPIPFWIGQVRSIPQNWAEGLVDSYVMPLDDKCKNCKGSGQIVGGGECNKCKSTGWVDINRPAPLFKMLSTTDPLVFDPQSYQAPPMKADVPEVLA